MSNFTMADIKRMRESHDARVAAAKAVLTGNFREILNTSTLPKGVKLWWPQNDKPEEAIMRIVDFQTTKAVNAGGTKPGEFSAFRRYKTHNLPDGRTVVCPTTYGKKCPLCETVAAHWDEIKNDKTNQSPYSKLRPKKMLLFNAVFKTPTESGSVKVVPRVVKCTEFYFIPIFDKALKAEEQFKPKEADKIYSYSDIELGYWFTARFGMAPAVATNPKSKQMMQLLDVKLDLSTSKMLPEQLFDYVADLDLLIPEAPSYEELYALIDERPVNVPAPKQEEQPEIGIDTGDAERPVSTREAIEGAVAYVESNPELKKKVDEVFDKAYGPKEPANIPSVEAMPQNPSGFATEEEVQPSDDFELGDFDIDA